MAEINIDIFTPCKILQLLIILGRKYIYNIINVLCTKYYSSNSHQKLRTTAKMKRDFFMALNCIHLIAY